MLQRHVKTRVIEHRRNLYLFAPVHSCRHAAAPLLWRHFPNSSHCPHTTAPQATEPELPREEAIQGPHRSTGHSIAGPQAMPLLCTRGYFARRNAFSLRRGLGKSLPCGCEAVLHEECYLCRLQRSYSFCGFVCLVLP
jgi:hypothetical protein